jgi:hypothetical protein
MCPITGRFASFFLVPALVFLIGPSSLRADDEPLIPAALNECLPKIVAGTSASELEKILVPAYPKAKARLGLWSGQTGYIDVQLDERFSLSVAAANGPVCQPVVHMDILIYVYDHKHKRRVEIKTYEWGDSGDARKPEKTK